MSGEKRFYWMKLQTGFFDSDEVRALETQQNGKPYIVVWLKLLLRAITQDQPGCMRFKTDIPYTDALLAGILKEDIDLVRSAMKAFQSLGMIELRENGDIWIEEARRLVGSESSSAERQRRFQAKKKALLLEATTPQPDKKLSADSDARFDEFWKSYPKKVERLAALAKWKATIRKGATPEQLIAAGAAYAVTCQGKDSQFIKHGATFLGDKEPWRDFLNGRPKPTNPLDAYDALTRGAQ